MKSTHHDPFRNWNYKREQRRLERAHEADWRDVRRRLRGEREASKASHAIFDSKNAYLLLVALGALVVLGIGFAAAMRSGGELTSLICIVFFVLLAVGFRLAWSISYFRR